LFGEVGIDPRAEPGLLVSPPQALIREDLVDAAALDRDALLLVEVGLQTIERPATEGQAQVLGVCQRGGDDLGPLLGGGGVRASGPGPILQAIEPSLVEAMDPGRDRGPGDAQVLGHLAGPSPVGAGQEDLGALDESGLCRP
jgi:hypothetical protein